MKIFEATQVREIDRYTMENEPVDSIDLMERAASRLTAWYVRHYHVDQRVVLFAGPGNNGGDALSMARQLAERQYRVSCYLLLFGKRSEDCEINLERLEKQGLVDFQTLEEGDELPNISPNDVVVDGIFGSGLSRPASGFPASVIMYINRLARRVISIDIPSGLFGEDNRNNENRHIIRAHTTLSFQFPFLSFFFVENADYVGHWRILDIRLHPEIVERTGARYRTLEKGEVKQSLPFRQRFSHKGSYGHALLISGCYGMMGAAILAGEACMRSGCGLLTLHVPVKGCGIVQTALPEAIVSMDRSDILFSEPPDLSAFAAVGIGPGMGCKPNSEKGLFALLEKIRVPLVIDADALNILSRNPQWLALLPENTILTPHPGEFDRLAGGSESGYERHLKQMELARRYKVIIVLKGAFTGIATPDGRYYFNTTGNPGMATGGSGDVLTGLITGLLAQGMRAQEAAMAAVFIHGLAGDLAAAEHSQEAMIAGDINGKIGAAFRNLFLHSKR